MRMTAPFWRVILIFMDRQSKERQGKGSFRKDNCYRFGVVFAEISYRISRGYVE